MPTARTQIVSRVQINQMLCREHYRLILRADGLPATQAGQFVQISCNDPVEDDFREMIWDADAPPRLHGSEIGAPAALLRRPFSLAGRRDGKDGTEIDIIHRVVGVGTDWLSRLCPGDTVNVLGPLGNRFILPPAGTTALLVSGGVGIPPMLYLATALVGMPAVAFSGALMRDLLPLRIVAEASPEGEPSFCIGEFADCGIRSVISTDDGSFGYTGFVTGALERYLDLQPDGHFIIYTCGPEPMLKRVAAIAEQRGIPCQIAVERAMACGMGTCQSCVIRAKAPGREWVYKLACTDGPVFPAADLLW